jgi:hypothetical protein
LPGSRREARNIHGTNNYTNLYVYSIIYTFARPLGAKRRFFGRGSLPRFAPLSPSAVRRSLPFGRGVRLQFRLAPDKREAVRSMRGLWPGPRAVSRFRSIFPHRPRTGLAFRLCTCLAFAAAPAGTPSSPGRYGG